MDFRFEKETHTYWLADRQLVGTTRVLETFNFLNHHTPWFTPEARDRGSRLHHFCAHVDMGTLNWAEVDLDLLDDVDAYEKWVAQHRFRPIMVEKPLYSKLYFHAGTLDVFGQFEGSSRYAVIDRKSGLAGLATGLQTGSYAQLVHEEIGVPLHMIDRFALQSLGESKPKMVPYPDKKEIPIFLSLVSAFYYGLNKGIFTLNSQPLEV